MTIQEAITARHSIRSYTAQPIAIDAVEALNSSIREMNAHEELHFQLVLEEPHAFTGLLSYGTFKGVRNYIACVGKKAEGVAEKIGYYGERLVLEAQTMGLSSCWVGLSYRKTPDAFVVEDDEKLYCVISLGYANGGFHRHKVKAIGKVSNASDLTPSWFRKGVEAALLAPTAVNQQKFYFEYRPKSGTEKPTVVAKKLFSLVGYTSIDLGIAKYHFEIGAGRENFEWGEK